jgi:hypothetical protein
MRKQSAPGLWGQQGERAVKQRSEFLPLQVEFQIRVSSEYSILTGNGTIVVSVVR